MFFIQSQLGLILKFPCDDILNKLGASMRAKHFIWFQNCRNYFLINHEFWQLVYRPSYLMLVLAGPTRSHLMVYVSSDSP